MRAIISDEQRKGIIKDVVERLKAGIEAAGAGLFTAWNVNQLAQSENPEIELNHDDLVRGVVGEVMQDAVNDPGNGWMVDYIFYLASMQEARTYVYRQVATNTPPPAFTTTPPPPVLTAGIPDFWSP